MISPELLRRYPFFGFLDDDQLRAVAMLAEEISAQPDEALFETGKPADTLYLLLEGGVDLHYVVTDRDELSLAKDFFISEFNPGDVFGVSALIEPYQYTATARVTALSRLIKIEGRGLRALCEVDPKLAYSLMRQVARTTMERLHDTRVQLVAARA